MAGWNAPYRQNNARGYNQNYDFQQQNFRPYGQSNGRNQAPARKKSGSKTGVTKKGKRYTTGWNKSSVGFVKFLCVETKNTDQHKSQGGRVWLNVMVKVQKQMSPEETTNGLMDANTGMVTIQSMGIVLNPKAPNGGYCGRYGGTRRR